MGFKPVDDSDLEPKRDRQREIKGGRMRPASFDEIEERRGRTSSSRTKTSKNSGNGLQGKKKKKKKKSAMSYVWTFLIVFGSTIGVFVIAMGIMLYCAMSGLFGGMGEINLEDFSVEERSVICFVNDDGEVIEEKPLSDRIWVSIDDVPEDMKNAFVAIEDERFYKHGGFDLMRTSKATVMYVWGKATGSSPSFGGSTITQQLIKNVTGNKDTTPARKIKEISQAVNLEKQLTKDEILELYLNVIYLSNNCYGVQTASMEFFGKPVSELSLAECACIAGITQSPSYYDPLHNPKNNKEKQEIVLSKMLELDYITQKEYNEAIKEQLAFKTAEGSDKLNDIDDYYVEYLISELTEDFVDMGYTPELARRKVVSGGLRIYTTIEPDVQKAIDDVYEDEGGSCANIFGYKAGAEKNPQSAMVVLDAKTGAIRGLTGGLGKKTINLGLNRVTIPRQPGSSIKPISVYAPAIDEGVVHASTVYSDSPENFNGWSPKNSYSGGGSKTIQLAIQKSSNIIAARVLRDLGISTSYDHLEKHLGVTSLTEDDKNLPALSLGGLTYGISPIEMAAAYTPFTNKGVYTKPYIYTKVYDRNGKLLLNNEPKTNQAISSQTAYIMTQLLQRVVTSGTGVGTQITAGGSSQSIFTAGKTGTTDDNKDKWFVGFTPNYICAVWHGYDDHSVVSSYTGGSKTAFQKVMTKIHEGLKSSELKSIQKPSGVTMISVCSETGKIASSGCNAISLPFTKDNKPTRACGGHGEVSEPKEDGVINLDEPDEGEEANEE